MPRNAPASTRVVETVSDPANDASATWTPPAAPIASAFRIVSGAAGPDIASTVTSPPCCSTSFRAASSAYSSFALTTAGDAARSSRKSGPRRSEPAAGSGTGLTRTTIRTGGQSPCVQRGARRSAPPPGECAGDDEPLDLLRSLVELGDLRIAHHPLDGELIDVAVTPEDLHGVGRDAHRSVTGDEFTHGRPSGRVRRTGLDLRAGLVQELPRGLRS